MRAVRHLVVLAVTALAAVAALAAPAAPVGAITGGTEDTANQFSNVALIVFYQPDGRFRCTGTLVTSRVVVTAAHCTYGVVGKVAVTFDPVIARSAAEAARDVPRAADDSGPDDAISTIGFTPGDVTAPRYAGDQTFVLGTPRTHPSFSDFTDLKNWNDAAVILLDTPVALPTTPLAPTNFLDAVAQPRLNTTVFTVAGYGTEVRQSTPGPRKPTAESLPIVRRTTTEIGQKLTPQVLQTNGNDKDPRAGGGTCFGDSGGPIMPGGYLVGATSYGYTDNCRHLDGYQRIDVPIVRSCLLDCIDDLVCPTKP